ncbi:MAG: diguanylate cyclase, partial [Mariprofundaceae bacterium]
MSQLDDINALLDDMDMVRPIVIKSDPDDPELRSITRRMISSLERLRQSPGVPAADFQWLAGLLSRLMDAEHGALLHGGAPAQLDDKARAALDSHARERQQLLSEAQQDIPATHQGLAACCKTLGGNLRDDESLQGKIRLLQKLLHAHLQGDASLHQEIQQLIAAIQPSLASITDVLQQAGEDSPELRQAKELLEQELPADAEQARKVLQHARQGILKAGNKLASASASLRETMQQHIQQLSSLSDKLEQAESEARNDPLTGLANRRHLAEFLKDLDQKMFGFLIVDIDHFKKINDHYGHDAGDEILKQLAIILKESTRATDLPARIGGEEFCVVFPESS